MRIAIYLNASRHQQQWARAFSDGLLRHGINPIVVDGAAGDDDRRPIDADLAVFWGHRRRKIIKAQQAAKRDYLVMERGYLGNRHKWTSLGFNGLNGRADFRLHARQDRSRFESHFGDLLQPWKSGGDYALLLGQVPGDASVAGVDLSAWYGEVTKKLAGRGEQPVMFRPHPLAPDQPPPKGATVIGGTLADALANAAYAVTYNSNSGVDAALAGVPVYALDEGSMARPVAADDLCLALWRPDRLQWAIDLSWCQWTEDEIRTGVAWDYLQSHS